MPHLGCLIPCFDIPEVGPVGFSGDIVALANNFIGVKVARHDRDAFGSFNGTSPIGLVR